MSLFAVPSELAAEGGIYWPAFAIGGTALFILFGLMFALLAFGKGREHS